MTFRVQATGGASGVVTVPAATRVRDLKAVLVARGLSGGRRVNALKLILGRSPSGPGAGAGAMDARHLVGEYVGTLPAARPRPLLVLSAPAEVDGDIDAEVAVALPNGRAVAFEVHPATSLFVVKVRAG